MSAAGCTKDFLSTVTLGNDIREFDKFRQRHVQLPEILVRHPVRSGLLCVCVRARVEGLEFRVKDRGSRVEGLGFKGW